MLKSRKIGQLGLGIALCAVSFLLSHTAQAATKTVHNSTELVNEFTNSTEDSTLKLASDFTASGTVNLSKGTSYNIIIDGMSVELKSRLVIATNAGGTVTFENMKFDGGETVSVGINVANSVGEVVIKDSTFENSTGSAISSAGAGGTLTIENSLFNKNRSASGGALVLAGTRDVNLKKSSVIENLNASTGYYGGAISSKGYNGAFIIENTKFIRNKATGAGAVLSGGGAIYMYQNGANSKFEVKESYFEGNETNLTTYSNESIDGGAIAVVDYPTNAIVNIDSTTFYDNKAGDDGGAILLQAKGQNKTTYITNSTFYKNIAQGKGSSTGYSGGAIQLYGNREGFSFGMEIYSNNNTFYMNEALAFVEDQEQHGGGIAASGFTRKSYFENDLFLGNIVEKNGEVNDVSNYKNIAVASSSSAINELGFDNGKVITNTPEEAYGKYPVVIGANQGKNLVGYSGDQEILPTLPIAPKIVDENDKVILGIANETGAGNEEFDQRGYKRLGKKDIGAIEIASTIYHTNGGEFNLEELKEYDGEIYYEGNKPEYYASIGTPDYTEKIVSGKLTLNASRPEFIFLGWSKDKDAKIPDPEYQTNSNHTVEDQLVLYAIWEKDEIKLDTEIIIYHGNGNTSGVAPKQNPVEKGAEITIKGKGTLKNKGYKFAGWSKKSVAIKADSTISPGKKVKVLQKTNFYAVWTRQ